MSSTEQYLGQMNSFACSVCFVCLSNLRILQKSPLSTSAGGEQWQEKALCLGSAGSCGYLLVGHILGFGEDELGEWVKDEKPTQLRRILCLCSDFHSSSRVSLEFCSSSWRPHLVTVIY